MTQTQKILTTLLTLVVEWFPDKDEETRKAIAADMAWAATQEGLLPTEAPEDFQARISAMVAKAVVEAKPELVRVLAMRENQVTALQAELDEAKRELAKLRRWSRKQLLEELERLQGMVREALGPGLEPSPWSVLSEDQLAAQNRLRAYMAGQPVVTKLEDTQARLAQAEETNRRSEAARMSLHNRVATLERVLDHIRVTVVGYGAGADEVAEYLRAVCALAVNPFHAGYHVERLAELAAKADVEPPPDLVPELE